jgi:hypothetical protein
VLFGDSFTRGFAAIGDPDVAVCMAPGTELVFDRDAEHDHPLCFFPTKKLGERMARFRQVNVTRPYEHHDALEFPSGRIVLVTRLCPGQRATVLQLPVKRLASDRPRRGANRPASVGVPLFQQVQKTRGAGP